jgi:hypothetical protein
MPHRAARRRAATLACALACFARLSFAQDPFNSDLGDPGFSTRPPPGAPRPGPKQPGAKPSDAPETHAASGAGDRLVTPGGEPTLPDDPLAIPSEVLLTIGSDKVLDEPSLGRSDALSRRFYGVLYEESNDSGYRFRSSFPPFWFERVQPSLKDPTKPDRASLFGLYYNRRSAERSDDILFPVFWNLRDLESRTTVVGPWMQRVAPDRADHWLAPLYFWGRRPGGGYLVIPPLLTYTNHDADGGFNLIGPYFCSWNGGSSCNGDTAKDLDRGLAPFYFSGHDELSEYRLIPPLLHYHNLDKRDLSSVDIWGPVYRKHTEELDALHVFPLYYSLWGKDERHTTLFPFFHVGHKGDASLLINPLFAYSNSELGYKTFITWGYASYRGKTELDMITPLFWHYRDPEIDLDQKLLLPFYFSRTSPRESSHVVFPFYANFERKGLSESTWITPLFQHSTDVRGFSTNIHPIFYFGRNGYDTHTVIAPFFWDFATRSSRTTIGFPLYWRFAEDDHTSQLIGNVYYSEQKVRQGLDWQVHVFPFFSYGETPDGHWWNVLYGLAGYERRGSMTKLKTFWIPIPLSE